MLLHIEDARGYVIMSAYQKTELASLTGYFEG